MAAFSIYLPALRAGAKEPDMPSEVRFAVVRRRLESCGFVLRRIKGSHHTFTKAGRPPVIIPVHHGKVKPVYVQEVERVWREEQGGGTP